jgi:aminopeptidase N
MRLVWTWALWLALLSPTAAAAARLPQTVVPEHYDLAFSVDLGAERFSGTETVRIQVTQPTTRVVLHAVDLDIRDATVGPSGASQSARVTFDTKDETATLSVARPLEPGLAEIRLRFNGTLDQKLRGFYISRTPRRKYAVTQFESTDARRAFPCFDEPALKATFSLALTVDTGDTAISNGRQVSDTPGPGRNRHTLTFATSPKMSSYLVAMAVGDFRCLEDKSDGVPIRACAVPEKASMTRTALDAAIEVLKYFHSYYTIKYPFGKLDLVAIPDFAASAMENTAAIFFRETDFVSDPRHSSADTKKNIMSVVAHEMAHQWFGDLVTMAWWDDLWLNEGFATWMATRPLEALHPEWEVPVDEAAENHRALALDSFKSTHAIRERVDTPDEIEAAFDEIVYEKGAAILRMVEQFVGADTFRSGVNAYLEAHAYGNARSDDFWRSIAAASGRPVDAIMPTFVEQPGVPLVDVGVTCEDGTARAELSQQRFSTGPLPGPAGSPLWQIPFCVKTDGLDEPGACYVLDKPRQVFPLGRGCPSWVFINAGGRGYYRTAYPARVLRALAPGLERSLTAPERLTILDDEWALVQAKRHTAADFLTIASGFGDERVSGVVSLVGQRLGFIGEYLVPEPQRAKFQRFVRSLFRASFDALGPEARAGESDDRRELRAQVIDALGATGADLDVIAASRAAVKAAIEGGAPLDPTTATALLAIAAAHGDATLFDGYLAARRRAGSPEEQYRYLNALPSFTSPALVERALQESRSSELKTQDTARYLSQFFANDAARDRAWQFLQEHWRELEPKVNVAFGDVRLVRSLGAFCDAKSAADVRTFFTAHPLHSAAAALDRTVEQIERCADMRRNESARVGEWLDSTVR